MLTTDVQSTPTSAVVARHRWVDNRCIDLVTARPYSTQATFTTSGTDVRVAIFDASWSAIEAKPMATENLLLHPDRWPLYSTS